MFSKYRILLLPNMTLDTPMLHMQLQDILTNTCWEKSSLWSQCYKGIMFLRINQHVLNQMIRIENGRNMIMLREAMEFFIISIEEARTSVALNESFEWSDLLSQHREELNHIFLISIQNSMKSMYIPLLTDEDWCRRDTELKEILEFNEILHQCHFDTFSIVVRKLLEECTKEKEVTLLLSPNPAQTLHEFHTHSPD